MKASRFSSFEIKIKPKNKMKINPVTCSSFEAGERCASHNFATARRLATRPRSGGLHRLVFAVATACVFFLAHHAQAATALLQIQSGIVALNPVSIAAGGQVQVAFNLINSVAKTVSPSTSVTFRLSASASSPSSTDPIIGAAMVPALSGGGSAYGVSSKLSIPSSTAAGNKYVWLQILGGPTVGKALTITSAAIATPTPNQTTTTTPSSTSTTNSST
jgi:hypothetical protein